MLALRVRLKGENREDDGGTKASAHCTAGSYCTAGGYCTACGYCTAGSLLKCGFFRFNAKTWARVCLRYPKRTLSQARRATVHLFSGHAQTCSTPLSVDQLARTADV